MAEFTQNHKGFLKTWFRIWFYAGGQTWFWGRSGVAALLVCAGASSAVLGHQGAGDPQDTVSIRAMEGLQAIMSGHDGRSPTLSGLQVAVLKGGKIRFSTALGMAGYDTDGHEILLRPDHKLRIASISKLVVAIGAMRLVEAGKLSLSDLAGDYLDIDLKNPVFDTPITVAHLLSHTSSVRDGNQYWLPLGKDLGAFFPNTMGDTHDVGGKDTGTKDSLHSNPKNRSKKAFQNNLENGPGGALDDSSEDPSDDIIDGCVMNGRVKNHPVCPPLGGYHYASDPEQGPGHWFQYSNLNFGLLAGVMERASGMRFDRFMRAQVFEPLGLNISYRPCDITRINPDALSATFRKLDDQGNWDPTVPWRIQNDGPMISCHYGMMPAPRVSANEAGNQELKEYKLGSNPTLFSPQGGLRASAKDIAYIFAGLADQREKVTDQEAQAKSRILRTGTVKQMLEPRWTYDPVKRNGVTTEWEAIEGDFAGLMTQYGLSVHIIDLKDWGLSATSHKLYGHLGDAYGLLGQAWFDPVSGDGLVALITGTSDDPAKFPGTSTPLFAPEEDLLKWWLREFQGERF